jgi:tetratricopeptide (TPR) repeat protein
LQKDDEDDDQFIAEVEAALKGKLSPAERALAWKMRRDGKKVPEIVAAIRSGRRTAAKGHIDLACDLARQETKEGNKQAWTELNKAIELDQELVAEQILQGNIGFAKRGFGYQLSGQASFDKGEYDKALRAFSEAIHLNPASPNGYLGRGGTYLWKDEYDKALHDYSEVIRLKPTGADGYLGRGAAHSWKKDYDKALHDYSEAIRLDPKLAAAYTGRARGYSRKKEYQKALADCTMAIKIDAKDPASCRSLAWLLATCPDASIRDGKKAVAIATKGCELSAREEPFILETLAAAYAEVGKFPEAVQSQQRAVKLAEKEKTDELEEMRARLKLYEQHKPYRHDPK